MEDPGLLRRFEPFKHLQEGDLALLATRCSVHRCGPNMCLFEWGSNDDWLYCLLEGVVELRARDGSRWLVRAGTDQALKPLAQVTPRWYTATTASPIAYLCIHTRGLGDYAAGIQRKLYDVMEWEENVHVNVNGELALFTDRVTIDDKIRLPSLPAVALKISCLIDSEETDAAAIARVINADPAIAAKLVRAANSPLYHGLATVDTCEKAVVRLGMLTTRQVVMSFALHDVFRTQSPLLRRRMQQLWEHSTEVAAISFTLARRTGVCDPEQALLAGLLHDIGVVPILTRAETEPAWLENPAVLEEIIVKERAGLSALILRQWYFPEAFVSAATHAEDWFREGGAEVDLTDLIIVAQRHALLNKPEAKSVPPMTQLPALRRLFGPQLDPALSLDVLKESREEIRHIHGLLAGDGIS